MDFEQTINSGKDKFRIVLVYLFLAMFSLLSFVGINFFVISSNINDANDDFVIHTNDIHQHLVQVTQSTNFILDGFSALLSSIGLENYETVVRYSNQVLDRVPYIYQIQAAQLVTKENLNEFNDVQSTFYNYKVKVFDGSQFQDATTSKSKIFYPITFFADKESLPFNNYGLDVQSLPFLAKSTELAQRHNKTVISEPFDTLDDERVFVMVQPAYFEQSSQPDFFSFFIIKSNILLKKNTLISDYAIDIHLNKQSDNLLFEQVQTQVSSWERTLLPEFIYEKEILIGAQVLVLIVKQQLSWAAIELNILIVIFFGSMLFLFSFYLMFKIHFDSELVKVKHSKQLFDLANFDGLTSLANRHAFNNKLEHSLKVAKRNQTQVGILFLDLDGFKKINDTLGHKVGDAALKLSADKIQATVRDIDGVGRLGGDEFAIILTNINGPDLCEEIKRRLKASVSSITEIQGSKVSLGTSVGYAIYPTDSESADELLTLADKYMYQDKKENKQV